MVWTIGGRKAALLKMTRLFTPRWIFRHLAVLAVFIILLNFGWWQLRRLEQKRERNRNIVAALNQPEIVITGKEPLNPADFNFTTVKVTGRFDNDAAMFLRNRSLNGASGVHLLTPLRISGTDQAVLVDRGWVPRGNLDPTPEELAEYALSGEITLTGIAYPGQVPTGFSPVDPPPPAGESRRVAWFRVDIERIQAQIPYSLLPIFIEQSPDSDETATTLPRRSESVTLDEGPHLGYAIQWFSFAAILLITYAVFMRQELRETPLS